MKQLSFLIAVALFLGGCVASSTKGGALGVDRNQLMLVSAQQMDAGALQAYSQTITKAQKEQKLNPDPVQTARVRNIGQKIISQVNVFRPDAQNWKWQINVIDDKQLNAWCMPGGKIAVYSGIIETLKLSDDELAAVMGHEIAHALREHSRERASSEQLKGIGLVVLQATTGADKGTMQLAQMASHYTISLPFSRSYEREADTLGIELMARAGYDPYAAVRVWEKMLKHSPSNPPEILSTHPSPSSRIEDLKELAAKVHPLYLEASRR